MILKFFELLSFCRLVCISQASKNGFFSISPWLAMSGVVHCGTVPEMVMCGDAFIIVVARTGTPVPAGERASVGGEQCP